MQDQFERIVGKIYDAALDADEWHGALSGIASTVGAVAGFTAGLDVRHGRGAYWYAIGHTPETQNIYNERFLTLDPTLEHIVKAPGQAFACSDYLTDAAVASSPFHQEFLIPAGIRYVLSGVTKAQGSRVNFFGFQRSVLQEPFGKAETEFMQRLIPHLARADEIANKINRISDEKRLAISMLDRIDYGILLVNHLGQICLSNQSAERWLETDATATTLFGRIRLSNPNDCDLLDKIIRTTKIEGGDAAIQTLETKANDGTGHVRLVVLPMARNEAIQYGEEQVSAAIVISDVNQQRSMASQLLKSTYGLTPAEIKVATGLASGKTQDDLCDDLCVSLATVKTHTQRIFQKTGVSRQVDLLRLIFGLPAVL